MPTSAYAYIGMKLIKKKQCMFGTIQSQSQRRPWSPLLKQGYRDRRVQSMYMRKRSFWGKIHKNIKMHTWACARASVIPNRKNPRNIICTDYGPWTYCHFNIVISWNNPCPSYLIQLGIFYTDHWVQISSHGETGARIEERRYAKRHVQLVMCTRRWYITGFEPRNPIHGFYSAGMSGGEADVGLKNKRDWISKAEQYIVGPTKMHIIFSRY